jgi:hypothetical protein
VNPKGETIGVGRLAPSRRAASVLSAPRRAVSVHAALRAVGTKFVAPLWFNAVSCSISILVGAVDLLRPVKAISIALQFRHRDPRG